MLAIAIVGALLWWWQRGRTATPEDGDGSEPAIAERDGRAAWRPAVATEAPAPIDLRARPWLRTAASIAGFVRDEAGHGIAGAQVCAKASGPRLPTEVTAEPRCTNSGSTGAYLLDALPPVRVEVSASAPTYQPGQHRPADRRRDFVELAPGQARGGIDIVLRSGGVEVHGVVKDLAGGVIEGALVSSRGVWWGNGGSRGAAWARSDDEGRFSLWLAPGEQRLWATAEGYADANQGGVAPGFTFELRLSPESVLAGRVIDVDGTAVADAEVTPGGEDVWGDARTLTDAEGRFRLTRLEPGRYKPIARHARGVGQVGNSVRLGVGETREGLAITVHPAASVRGRVVIAGEPPTPCDLASVSLQGEHAGNAGDAATTADGEVEIPGLLPDTYRVQVRCEGKLARPKYEPIVLADADSEGHVWKVDAGAALRGRVQDASGAAVPGASLWAAPADNAGRGQQAFAAAVSDPSDGSFELAGLLPGRYDVHVSAEGFVESVPPPQATIPEAGDGDITLTLQRGGVIEGRVVDEHGQAVAGATVRVSGLRWRNSASTGDDGHFRIDAVEAGEHRVFASEDWQAQMRAPGSSDDDIQGERVTVRDGEAARVELRVESQSGRIRGRVVDDTGGPVDDAFLTSTRERDSAAAAAAGNRERARWGGWDRPPVLTDADGEFTLEQLAAGKHTIVAMRKGGGEGVVEHVEVGSTGVVVTIAAGGRIAGTVGSSSGASPTRFTIHASDDAQGIARSETFFHAGGTWSIDDLPPGKYQVRVESDDGAAQTEVALAAGEVKSGVKLELTPLVDVRGTVVDLETGEPVAGLQVLIAARAGGFSFSFGEDGERENVTDDGGAFTVEHAPSGKVTIMVVPRSFGGDTPYGWTRIAAQIPGDAATYELPALRVAKRRTKRGQRPGDLGFELAESPPDQVDEAVTKTVAVVRPRGPAAAAGLAVGDEIVAVDGHDVRGVEGYRYPALVGIPEGQRVTLELAGGRTVAIVAGPPI